MNHCISFAIEYLRN